ncbi:hydroxymethylpyrimidine/phosphomethylpyrimidine kinase [Sulfuriferula nivalis]|uniref:hydroxymethylpyrimidine kinase n=2 Tax=Sulfuriferula nivalis TaxID=2675298 RepID=A0A809SAW8_9PROT|nr:hydroxymethylpyrimidine/phosphomethylpyrimidine kinase [Sulfuriferula nivalis]
MYFNGTVFYMNESPPPIVLTFAASDPTGGAGIQADILTMTSMGCHALSVLTAITVQDTVGVEDYFPLDAEWISDQARCLLEDMPVAAFKIGMLGSLEALATIAAIVADYPDIPLILDPVLASGRGDELSTDDMRAAMMDMLIPQTTIITPNSVEARNLVQDEIVNDNDALDICAQHLLATGCEYVLITGTHEGTAQVINTLYDATGELRADTWTRLPGSYHGSGCTLASAIAAALAHGMSISDAVHEAQAFTYEALRAGFRPGMGQFIPDRLFWARDGDKQ